MEPEPHLPSKKKRCWGEERDGEGVWRWRGGEVRTPLTCITFAPDLENRLEAWGRDAARRAASPTPTTSMDLNIRTGVCSCVAGELPGCCKGLVMSAASLALSWE